MKRGLFFFIGVLILSTGLMAQQEVANIMDGELNKLKALKELKLPQGHMLKSLPTTKDNTASPYFPEVFGQHGWSCNQASSIGYVFTYEMNAIRDLAANSAANLYPPLAVWSLLNDGDETNGVSYFDTWKAISMNGIPNLEDYNYNTNDGRIWMTGYDKYYRGMQNRTEDVYYINTRTEEGINTLKHWLNDRMDGSPYGGVGNFQIGSTGMKHTMIPEGEEGAGKQIMTSYNDRVGHAMTVVGWNDDIRWDFNLDGVYTNDVDINDDGIVNARDWENGAFLVVNSWGQGWCDFGYVYVPYRLFAEDSWHDGIWQSSVTVIKPRKEYLPKLTYKVGMSYTKRGQLKIIAGVSQSTTNNRPDHVLEFPFFNYNGGELPMQGILDMNSDFIEFGIDVSPLLQYIDPDKEAKFYLDIYQHQGDSIAGNGEVKYFSLMDYGGNDVFERASPMTDESIKIDAVTRLWALYNPVATIPVIATNELPQAEVGQGFITALTATGGIAPYSYEARDNQYIAYRSEEKATWPAGAEKILGITDTSRMLVDLGFPFTFYGKTYTELIVMKDGGLVMGAFPRDYPYVVDKSLFIYQNAGVYPLFGNLEYYFIEDGVYRLDQSDGVIFAWDATMMEFAGVYNPKFSVKLYKNGRIEFRYHQAVALNSEWDWISAVSAGDMLNFTLPDINTDELFRGELRYDFKYFEWPDWLFFSPSGALLGSPTPEASSMWLPITVTDKYGSSSSKNLFLDVKGGTGIDDVVNSASLKVYPNPVKDLINISLGENYKGEVIIELFQLDGRQILNKTIESTGSDLIQVDLSQIHKSGSFIYRIKANNKIKTGKLIKTK